MGAYGYGILGRERNDDWTDIGMHAFATRQTHFGNVGQFTANVWEIMFGQSNAYWLRDIVEVVCQFMGDQFTIGQHTSMNCKHANPVCTCITAESQSVHLLDHAFRLQSILVM